MNMCLKNLLRHLPLASVFVTAMVAFFPQPANADDAAAAEQLFTLKVLPLLKTKCFACHGEKADDVKGELDMRSRESLLKGGESEEPSLIPGQPDKSPLFRAIKWDGLEMPPKENDRLNAEQIEWVRRWIAAGAPWPDAAAQKRYRELEWSTRITADGVLVKTSGGLSDDWTYRRYKPADVWAFQPLKKVVPSGKTKSPIDQFHGEKLTAAKVAPAPPADPRTLIRRATLDLIGLPPTPAEIDSFVAAWKQDSEQAWLALIDRLLASSHYGERWAQHWLDVTRYADTGGYSNDYERSNMWRYRDYVIRAFNDDKPYNQFIIEQLAGDELADASVRKRSNGNEQKMRQARLKGDYNEQESEWVVATGFLRIGPWDNAMVKSEEARQIYLDDLVNAVGQTFLSTTMRCFKCHDHKFDPLPTRDYYRVYAAFAGTQIAERPVPFLQSESREHFAEGKAHAQKMLAFATAEKNRLTQQRETAAKTWFAERKLPYIPEGQRVNLPDEQKPPRNVGLDHVAEGQLKVREQDEWIWTRQLERYEPMAQSVYDGAEVQYAWNGARKLRIAQDSKPNWRPDSRIYLGGSLEAPGPQVTPGVLSSLGLPVADAPKDDPAAVPPELEGRRLTLAKWIADPRNGLATRSIVNRVWEYHFGQPLAGNPNNFGAKGAKPTHPELLDWLAADFTENGWTLKRLHKLIMTSAAYQQSASHPQMERLRSDDPNNALLAYFPTRRLTAEELRDGMLSITGELNPALGGLPNMPEMNMEVALQPRMIQFSIAPAYQPSRTPEERNRRSIYAYRVRGQADPFLEVFNLPNPNESCDLRDSAAVSPQAFTLMNSAIMLDRSLAFALRLEKEADTVEQQIFRAFALALGRAPSAAEQERMSEYVRKMTPYHRGIDPEPVKYPTRITRSLVEEFSGKVFEYEEILPVFENYVPDKKAADVGPATRALADLCLLLLNSNEFIFVY